MAKRKLLLKALAIGLTAAIVGGAGAALWVRSMLAASSAAYEAGIQEAETTFLARLKEWLDRPDDPRNAFDLQIFLSKQILEKIADTVRGETISFGKGNSLRIDDLRFELRRGFPLVFLEGDYKDAERGISFGGDIAAVLELDASGDAMVLRIRPISVRPALGLGSLRVALKGLLGDVSQQLARDYADAWPGIELPVQTLLPLRLPPTDTPVVIKLGDKQGDPWIKARFDFPPLGADLRIVYRGLVFTEEGVHLFADVQKAEGARAQPVVRSPEWQAMDTDAKLRAIGFGESDLGARVSKRLFVFAVARIDELPRDDKTIRIQGEERSGDIASGNLAFVHYDVWLENPPATRGVLHVDQVRAEVSEAKNEILRYRAKGVAEIEGLLGLRVSLGKPKDGDRGKTEDKNPVTVKFKPTEVALGGRFVLTKDGDLPIIAIMIDPTPEIQTSCRFRVPGFGHITIQPKLRLPETRMTRIKLPPTFDAGGEVQLGDERTPYRIGIEGMKCVGETHYLILTANAELKLGGD